MLVIISDLHLTDGTSGSTISTGAFHLLAERLGDLAVRASSRSDGSYRPIERIDLLLLGDVLDVIRSSRWLSGDVRPWDSPYSPEMVETVSAITNDILRHNADALAVLRGLSIDGAIRVPPASNLRRPALGAEGQPVPVRVHYMVGNHDWFFHLPGDDYSDIRGQVARHLGLATPSDAPFPHDPRESGELMDVLQRHRTFARHGDIFDPFNFEQDRDASSLGDAIVVELLNRFSNQVEQNLAADLPADTILGLREIDNIRPLLLIPVWIDGLLERTCSFPAMRKQVKLVWDQLAEDFLDLGFVRSRDSWSPIDLVDGLQRALRFSKKLPIGWASSIAQWIHKVGGAGPDAFFKNALAEQDFRNRRAQHIVYGHTHNTESVPLDASFAEGLVLNQTYFNSGTWRRVHRQTTLAPGEHEFIASDTMTYLAFFQGDERGGRPYETWTGTLALSPQENAVHRVDQGVAHHAAGQSISSPDIRVHRPHFAAQAAHAPVVPTRRV
jgi:hypothetical protein